MEVKPGYKQTEVGVIPEEWDAVSAGSIGGFRGGNGFPLEAQGEAAGDYPFFKVSDMNNEGNETFMVNSNNWISEQTRKRLGATSFPVGGIVFAKVGAAVFLERKRILSQPSCIDNNMAAYVLDERRADIRFIHTQLLSKKFGALVATTALPALNGKQLGEMQLALPPPPEQRAIAEALSDVDGLLGGLDRLIAKKRDLKQAAMQQLLTGQTRLPGFQGEWEVKKLGELAKIQRGASPRPIDSPVWFDDGSLIGWVRISDVTGAGMFLLGTTQRLSSLGVKHSRPVASGSLIMSICATIGRPIITKIDVCIHDGFVVFDNLQADQLFLYYVLKWIETDWSKHGQTGSQMNLNTGLINGTRISLPPLPEQTAIASVLSEMDGELAALEQRREKTRALKQAMMQELLTGRIRLL